MGWPDKVWVGEDYMAPWSGLCVSLLVAMIPKKIKSFAEFIIQSIIPTGCTIEHRGT